MFRTLLVVAALSSQAFSLVGPAFVWCVDRDGAIHLEYVGEDCPRCRQQRPAASAGDAAIPDALGYRHDGSEDAGRTGLRADPPCDCRHVPITDGAQEPCVVAGSATADLDAVSGIVLPPAWLGYENVVAPVRSSHDPPDRSKVPFDRHSHFAGGVLRC